MSYQIVLLPKAHTEILDAWMWYEDKEEGLGDRFKDAIVKKIKSVANHPLYYSIKKNYREAKVDVFPYLIIFKTDEKNNRILIVSVFHTGRHPGNKF